MAQQSQTTTYSKEQGGTKYRPPMRLVSNLESDFREWQIDEKENEETTANTYWSRLKNFPYFDLNHWRDKPYYNVDMDVDAIIEQNLEPEDDEYPDLEEVLDGLISSKLSDSHQLSTIYVYLDFLKWKHEEDEDVSSRQVSKIKKKRAHLKEMLEYDSDDSKPDINEHYLHKNQLVALLKEADPERARYWATLYMLGCRYGELKKLARSDNEFFPPSESESEHGHVYIPDEKSKSKEGRRVEFKSPLTYRLMKYAPTGEFNGIEGAFFPDRNNDDENYQLGRRKTVNGEERIYGLITDVDEIDGTRTIHSFRHIRITDLINDNEKFPEIDTHDVQKRVGHQNFDMTKHYEDASLRRKPKALERYVEEEFEGDYDRFIEKVIDHQS